MGIFKFLKGAGQKAVDLQKRNIDLAKDIFDGDDEAKKVIEKAEKDPSDKEVAEVARQLKQAEAIRREAIRNKLGGDFRMVVDGETVRLSGEVPDQETLEKVILTAGNMEGISEVDATAIKAATAGPDPVFYEVQKGDSLSKIAKKFYGNAMKYPVIFEANKPMLTDPDKIYPGQTLRIPGGKADA